MKFAKTRQRQCKFSQKSPRIVPRAVASSCVIIKRTLWPLIPWQSGRPRSESCGWSCGLACVFRESPASLLRRFRGSPLWSPLRFFLPQLVPAYLFRTIPVQHSGDTRSLFNEFSQCGLLIHKLPRFLCFP